MKSAAIKYLVKNPLLHMGMIEPIRRDTAEILYAEIDGVLIKEQKSNAYMISVDNFEKGQELINCISKCNLIIAHQKFIANYISSKLGLNEELECFQSVYIDKAKIDIKSELEIRQLKQNQIEIILKHYNKLSNNEIEKLLKSGNIFGGYKNNVLIGFIGTHLEGSIGLLEIFPEYRRLGYGTILESHMVNKTLENGLVPFSQVEVENKKSIALQKKLGFKISKDKLY
ncbi:GNAT family N-acetyltransferase [Clostridium beijerinckii]|nr:GNAT family N-acetyltransferase [Clostridium beijerinckii]MBA8934651.1 GNAT superfamily N-acetyltransferase [Clostridium beijerinckii]NRU39051.1 GNAT superfamily N-acetyltransferase [Clostridium beijerinckii]NSA97670.1 GNAT superfamily N-acetyltransferase [Clostridium beijerinckii]OOM60817.1 FR47-like protein [Clostridium beijerinckii]OOM69272.1 FR47-like protein [Clostridium beijerinckii]